MRPMRRPASEKPPASTTVRTGSRRPATPSVSCCESHARSVARSVKAAGQHSTPGKREFQASRTAPSRCGVVLQGAAATDPSRRGTALEGALPRWPAMQEGPVILWRQPPKGHHAIGHAAIPDPGSPHARRVLRSTGPNGAAPRARRAHRKRRASHRAFLPRRADRPVRRRMLTGRARPSRLLKSTRPMVETRPSAVGPSAAGTAVRRTRCACHPWV